MRPVFAQHTDCPTVPVTAAGVNEYSFTSTVTAAPLLAHRSVAEGEEPVESPPQATAVRAKSAKAKSARLVRMGKNLTGRTSANSCTLTSQFYGKKERTARTAFDRTSLVSGAPAVLLPAEAN